MPYSNRMTLDGFNDSFIANEDIAIYSRVKFVAGSTPSGQARIAKAGATEVAFGVSMQPITNGLVGNIALLNSTGMVMGVAASTIAVGDVLYAAANGTVGTSNAGGALAVGTAQTASYATGRVTYSPLP